MKEPRITINQDIVQIVAEIDAFKGRWQASKTRPERLQQLRRIATVENVGASTRIAGATLTNVQVGALQRGESGAEAELAGEAAEVESEAAEVESETAEVESEATEVESQAAEVKGYARALERVIQTHQDLDLSSDHIHQLHQIMLGIEDAAEHNKMESPELDDLLRWTSKAFNEASMHPLLITAIFKVIFLAIQPFQNGDGRLSRLLTLLLLLRAGYGYVPYASLDAVFEKDKTYYHKALQRTQSTLDDDSPDWQPWFAFFLRCLKTQTSKLTPEIEFHQGTDSEELSPLALEVLVLLSQHHSLTIMQIAKLAGAEKSTLEPTLRELSEAGHIQRHGEAQAIEYSLPH